MAKFFSYPGAPVIQRGDGPPSGFWDRDRVRADPRYAEFYRHRAATSHTTSGLDIENDVDTANALFNGAPARVVHEEFDQHSGEVKTIVQVSSKQPDTREVSWAPVDERRIEIRQTRQIHE